MSISEPTAGSPIEDSWGVAVAQQLNRAVPLVIAADVATNSASAQDTGIEFTVVSGRHYNLQVYGSYEVSATNQGLQLGLDKPAGTYFMGLKIGGNGAGWTFTEVGSAGSLAGRTSTDSATTRRAFFARLVCSPTANGTVKLQFARGGTSGSTGVTIHGGAGGVVLESST